MCQILGGKCDNISEPFDGPDLPLRTQERVSDMSDRHWCSALIGNELMHTGSQEAVHHR